MARDESVLIGIALSPRAVAVVKEGLRTADALGARPLFLHVGNDTPDRRRSVRQVLTEAAPGREFSDDQLILRDGNPGSTIIEAAEEFDVRMVLMGALDRDPPMTRLWGSVARQVARGAPCSVLLLPAPRGGRSIDRKIVVNVELTEESIHMIDVALLLARGAESPQAAADKGAEVHFVHDFSVSETRYVISSELQEHGKQMTTDEYIRVRTKAEEFQLREFLSGFDLRGLKAETIALAGHEGVEAVDYARDHDADLLVIPAPRKRLTFFDRVFHHPVEMALERLPCGLLLYRPGTTRGKRRST